MKIRRSEVYFDLQDDEDFQRSGKQYVTCGIKDQSIVFKKEGNGLRGVCRVSDLIDDRPDPFPSLVAESSSDTPTDRARDAALRDCKG